MRTIDGKLKALALIAAVLLVVAGALYMLWPQMTLAKRRAYSATAIGYMDGGAPRMRMEAEFTEPPYICDDFSVLRELDTENAERWASRELMAAGVLRVEALKLELPVFHGAGKAALRFGAGLVEPFVRSSGSTVVLAGVCGGVSGDRFADIASLSPGDKAVYKWAGGTEQSYMVREIKKLPADMLVEELSSLRYDMWLALTAPSSPFSADSYTVVWCKAE